MSFSLYSKDDDDIQLTTLLGKDFHTLIILLQKNYFFASKRKLNLYSLYILPLVLQLTNNLILLLKLIHI